MNNEVQNLNTTPVENTVAPVQQPVQAAPVQENTTEKKEIKKKTNKVLILDEDPIYIDVKEEEPVQADASPLQGSSVSAPAPAAAPEKIDLPSEQSGNITF